MWRFVVGFVGCFIFGILDGLVMWCNSSMLVYPDQQS